MTGGELWRSSDTVTWTKVPASANGFGNPLNTELHNIRVAQGQLWVTTISTASTPFPVFRSSDGVNFVQSNPSGFGDPNNTSVRPNNFGTSVGFGSFVYWGGANAVTGAQVWRLDLTATVRPHRSAYPQRSQFRAGQTLTIGIDARNPVGNAAADLYVGAMLPDGQTLVFLSDRATLAGTGSLASPSTFVRALPAAPGFALTTATFFQFTFPATGIPPGTYQVFAVPARPPAFADNRIDPGDILASDVRTLTFAP